MNRLGTKIARHLYEAQGWEWNPAWLGVECIPIEPELTPKQQRGYWKLLSEWLKLKPMRGVDREDLHKWVCCTHFGHIERELPDGRIDWIPIRTTTKVWVEDENRYKRRRLSREKESALIDFVYRAAAEGGVILPELEKDSD